MIAQVLDQVSEAFVFLHHGRLQSVVAVGKSAAGVGGGLLFRSTRGLTKSVHELFPHQSQVVEIQRLAVGVVSAQGLLLNPLSNRGRHQVIVSSRQRGLLDFSFILFVSNNDRCIGRGHAAGDDCGTRSARARKHGAPRRCG